MARTWISAESRQRLRHRQYLAELDAQNRLLALGPHDQEKS